jgi:hypothetical protein
MPVLYIDFGFGSAREFANAIGASVHAWHVHEWIWHDQHPGENTKGNPNYKKFQKDLINNKNYPELAWIRDVADAGKHRGLGRVTVDVQQVASKTRFVGPLNTAPLNTMPLNHMYSVQTPLVITLTDGNVHGFAEALSRVIDYWRAHHFQ